MRIEPISPIKPIWPDRKRQPGEPMKSATRKHLINASDILEEELGEWVSVTVLYQPDSEYIAMKKAYDEIFAALESE